MEIGAKISKQFRIIQKIKNIPNNSKHNKDIPNNSKTSKTFQIVNKKSKIFQQKSK